MDSGEPESKEAENEEGEELTIEEKIALNDEEVPEGFELFPEARVEIDWEELGEVGGLAKVIYGDVSPFTMPLDMEQFYTHEVRQRRTELRAKVENLEKNAPEALPEAPGRRASG